MSEQAVQERCTTCGGPMVIENLHGDDHDSWVCDKDGTAWAVDQEWANSDPGEDW
jgi:hypothetical protein